MLLIDDRVSPVDDRWNRGAGSRHRICMTPGTQMDRTCSRKQCCRISSFFFLGICFWIAYCSDSRHTRVSLVRQTYKFSLQAADLMMLSVDAPSRASVSEQKRIAICLVGGARAFQLTGPSIKSYLLDYYKDADVFVHAPIDADVHKLTLLNGARRLTSIRLFVPNKLNETRVAQELLRASDSPNGIQGLLQYFRLVEGCLDMIEEHEALHAFKYDWVIRTRLDGYWNAPMPPIYNFNSSKYYVPYGSGFGGLNDRLGVGSRETSEVALARLSLLSKIHGLGHRGLNSETAFKAQFDSCNVEVEFGSFPFCVLSTRKYSRSTSVPVTSIRNKGPLNGAKCRPCTPRPVGELAWKELDGSRRSRGLIASSEDPQLCDAHQDWEVNWEEIYDTVSGPEMAQLRKSMSNQSLAQCILEMQRFEKLWEVWDGPSAEVLCAR